MTEDDQANQTWDQLPLSIRKEILRQANGGLWWQQAGQKIAGLKTPAQFVVTIAAAYSILSMSWRHFGAMLQDFLKAGQ